MLFGLAGSHRSGKTTLAKAISEELGITYVSNSFGESCRKYGVDPVAPMNLTDRVAIQNKILKDHLEFCLANTEAVIVDRTPIDYLAYTLAEFGMQSHMMVEPEVLDLVSHYKELCMSITGRFYDTLFVVGPLDTYAAEPGKPAFNRAYQDHIQLLIDGAVCNLADSVQMNWINVTDLEDRKAIVHQGIVERLDLNHAMRQTSAHLH